MLTIADPLIYSGWMADNVSVLSDSDLAYLA
jgi:hypothetical protein